MMKKLLVVICAVLSLQGVAQQDAIYSQYMFNPFAVNPAYAGSRESMSAVLLHRSQWVGIEGAPTTQTLSLHSPLRNKKMALGLNITNDVVGPVKSLGAFGTYAYHLPFSTGKLSLALRGGVYNATLDRSMLDFENTADRFSNTGTVTALVPSFDFGAYYYTRRFYIGGAGTHLTQQSIGYEEVLNAGGGSAFRRHFMLGTGYAVPVNDNVVLKPSLLVKYVDGAPMNIDINFSALFKKVFWLGMSLRTAGDLVLITEFNVTDYLRIGYSYDIILNELGTYSTGSHEVFVGFDFALSKQKTVSPRFL
jgi:type IX secretion system PorP/SprF family membrane protein